MDEDEKFRGYRSNVKVDVTSGVVVNIRGGSQRVRATPARTLPVLRVSQRSIRNLKVANASEEVPDRPRSRGDCVGGERPCCFVSCKFNLYLDVDPQTGSLKLNFPDIGPEEMPARASCALDVASLGGTQLEVVGSAMNVTRERARQIEEIALARAEAEIRRLRLRTELQEASAGREVQGTPLALAQETESPGVNYARTPLGLQPGEEREEEGGAEDLRGWGRRGRGGEGRS